MSTGTKMPSFTRNNEKEVSKRGRPARHESERVRAIAWYHALAGDRSSAEMTRWSQLADIDQATIYRYRSGQISPRADMLDRDDEAFQSARHVYETGPFNVPLWDAMWGTLTLADFKLADHAMPGGDWPFTVIQEQYFDDTILARIMGFQQRVVRAASFTSDLEAFAVAVRVFRACEVLGQGNKLALRVLLEGTMAVPTVRTLLAKFGLVEPMREWVAAQFHGTSAEQEGPAYWAPWMDNDDLFFSLCRLADLRQIPVRRSISSRQDTDFERVLITDSVQGEYWH